MRLLNPILRKLSKWSIKMSEFRRIPGRTHNNTTNHPENTVPIDAPASITQPPPSSMPSISVQFIYKCFTLNGPITKRPEVGAPHRSSHHHQPLPPYISLTPSPSPTNSPSPFPTFIPNTLHRTVLYYWFSITTFNYKLN